MCGIVQTSRIVNNLLILFPPRQRSQMAEIYKIDELKAELARLLRQQSETLEARVGGGASDTDII
jgi:hypothetical protein